MLGKFSKVSMLAIILGLVAVTMISAAGPYSSSASGFFDGTQTWRSGVFPFNLVNAQGGNGTCTTQDGVAFYRWDLSAIDDAALIGDASISIPVLSSSIPTASSVTLYRTTNNTWPPTLASLGDPLQIVSPASGLGTLTFPTSAAFAQYVQDSLPGNTVNFAIRWSSCAGSSVVLSLQLNTTGQLSLERPTAVALSSLEAQQPAPNWPLYIGLAALSMLIVGLLFYRRRAVSR